MILSTSNYDIHLVEDLDEIGQHLDLNGYSTCIVLVDENSRALCLPSLVKAVPQLGEATILEIPSGEGYKNIGTCKKLWDTLLRNDIDRHALWINLGGGVVSDLGGFVAATYKRGIDIINIPTTLLAQVDATIGGKLGVNHSSFKNVVGLFSNPRSVYISPLFLATLSKDLILCGYAEMLKHGLIANRAYWEELRSIDPTSKQVEWALLISRSLTIKNQIVEEDFREAGLRKVLNFGHTIGHALESCAMGGADVPLLHGQAVGLGMIAEAFLSAKVLGMPGNELDEIAQYLSSLYGKYHPRNVRGKDILSYLGQDKKNRAGKVNFTLLKTISSPQFDVNCDSKSVEDAMGFLREQE